MSSDFRAYFGGIAAAKSQFLSVMKGTPPSYCNDWMAKQSTCDPLDLPHSRSDSILKMELKSPMARPRSVGFMFYRVHPHLLRDLFLQDHQLNHVSDLM